MGQVVHKRVKGQPTDHGDDEERTRVWVLTTGDTDRDGETVDPEGGDFSEYALNSAIQWNHSTDDESIGQMIGMPWNEEVGEGTKYPEILGPKRMALLGRVKFSKVGQKANEVWEKVKEGTIKAGSISFVPLGAAKKNSNGGNHYPTWKLLEFTICSIGSNPSAIATLKKCLKNADGTCKTSCGCNPIKQRTLSRQEKFMRMQKSVVQDIVNGYDNVKNLTESEVNALAQRASSLSKQDANDTIEAMGFRAQPNAGKKIAEFIKARYASFLRSGLLGRPGKHMRRKVWINWHTKTAWLLRKQGGVTKSDGTMKAEIEDYIEERGLDEVRIEDGPPEEMIDKDDPTLSEWVEEEMAEPEHQGIPAQEMSKAGQPTRPNIGDTFTGPDGKTYTVRHIGGFDDYAGMWRVKVEEDNNWTFYRGKSMTGGAPTGKTEEVADDVAVRSDELVEQGVDDEAAVEAAMEEEGVPKSMRPAVKALVARKRKGTNVRRKSDAVEEEEDKTMSRKGIQRGSVVRTKNGNLCIVKDMDADKAKLVKVGGDEVLEDKKSLKLKSNDWGLPTKDEPGWGLPAKMTNWYGQLTNVLKTFAPALKDVDLTGEEQGQVEEEVEQAFMKLAKDLGIDEETKAADDFSKGDRVIANNGKSFSKRLPHQQLKSYIKHPQHWVHSKLAATVADRTWKMFKSIVKDASQDECVEMMCKEAEAPEMTEEAAGIVAASAKNIKEKWQQKYGACGKQYCTKDWLCSKCVKKLKSKLAEQLDLTKQEVGYSVGKAEDGYLRAEDKAADDPSDNDLSNNDSTSDAVLDPDADIVNDGGTPTPGGTDQLKSRALRMLAKMNRVSKSEEIPWGKPAPRVGETIRLPWGQVTVEEVRVLRDGTIAIKYDGGHGAVLGKGMSKADGDDYDEEDAKSKRRKSPDSTMDLEGVDESDLQELSKRLSDIQSKQNVLAVQAYKSTANPAFRSL